MRGFLVFLLGTKRPGASHPQHWALFQGVDVPAEYLYTILEAMHFKHWTSGSNPAYLVKPTERDILAQVGKAVRRLCRCLHRSQPLTARCMELALAHLQSRDREAWLEQAVPMKRGPSGTQDTGDSKTLAEACRMCLYAIVFMETVATHATEHIEFNEALEDFYLRPPRPEPGDRPYASQLGYLSNGASLFALAKSWSVIWAERQLNRAARDGWAGPVDRRTAKGVADLLRLNILEAYLGDTYYTKLKDNAFAASVLLRAPPVDVTTVPSRRRGKSSHLVHLSLDPFYAALYFNWNLTFVTAGRCFWLSAAKLLQPLVACASPERFIVIRAISLKITVQTLRWNEFLGKPYMAPLEHVFTQPVREAMARVNGDAAAKYAEHVLRLDARKRASRSGA